MANNHASLDAAAIERKTRLAQLRGLKRKHPSGEDEQTDGIETLSPDRVATPSYLSGRNYDPEVRGPKLGFESAPTENQITLEDQAAAIAKSTAEQAAEEEKSEKPIDLFRLQPKKPNWDLKRDLERKLDVLNVRTDNAIAKLVRQRIESAQKIARPNGNGDTGDAEGEKLGIEGTTLLEGIRVREREEESQDMADHDDVI